MSVITVHPNSEAQEKALEVIFEAFNVKYEKELDETEYLMASKANREALNESIQQLENGEGIKVSLEDLWK
jgi:hypothetical protein